MLCWVSDHSEEKKISFSFFWKAKLVEIETLFFKLLTKEIFMQKSKDTTYEMVNK